MKRIYFFALLLLIAGACDNPNRGTNNTSDTERAENTNNNGIENRNTDDNDFMNNNEFKNAFTNSEYYSKWNANGDDHIDKKEFYQGYIRIIDQNKDQVLSRKEWQEGINSYFGTDGAQEYGEFSEWDKDGNGEINTDEFTQRMSQTNFFAEWDQNGNDKLEEEEFAEETFAMWDKDGNGVIEADEYAEWERGGTF